MKQTLALLAALTLAGCTTAPVTVYDRQGVSVSRLSNDYAACRINAERQAPVLIQNQTSYGTAIGIGTGGCYGGFCSGGNRGGIALSVDNRRVDVNEGRRFGLLQQCMFDRGYAARQLPGCSNEARSGVPIGSDYRQPAITQQSCAVQVQGVGPVVITP